MFGITKVENEAAATVNTVFGGPADLVLERKMKAAAEASESLLSSNSTTESTTDISGNAV
jgi:hypothetical protein